MYTGANQAAPKHALLSETTLEKNKISMEKSKGCSYLPWNERREPRHAKHSDICPSERLVGAAEPCRPLPFKGNGEIPPSGVENPGWEPGERSWVTALQLCASRRLRHAAPFPGGRLQPLWLLPR